MADLLVRDRQRHMERPGWEEPFCGGSFKSRYVIVDDWALVTCRGCQKKRIAEALRAAGFSHLEIYEAAANKLGVSY